MTNNDTTATEYIPTDDHMRSLFCLGYAQGDFDKHDQAWATWEKWLAAHDARAKAEAWTEGSYAGYGDCKHDIDTPNPYAPGDQ